MRILTLLIVCLSLGSSGSLGLDLPQPPEGYTWEECSEIGGALLRPEHWSFRRVSDAGKLAYFITKEPWKPPEAFDVGFTFNVLFDVAGQTGLPPTEFGRRFVARAAEAHRSERTWTNEMGPFKAEGIVYSGTGDLQGFKFFNLVIANDNTGTAYLAVFEAPEPSWEVEWSAIEPTIQSLYIDDEY